VAGAADVADVAGAADVADVAGAAGADATQRAPAGPTRHRPCPQRYPL